MAIEYSILISKKCLKDSMIHESVQKVSNINPIIINLPQGLIVRNTEEKIGFNYSLLDTKNQLWGYEDELLADPFEYEEVVGFRLNKQFDYDNAMKNLFKIFFDLLSKIPHDLILLSGDSLVLFRKNNIFFSTENNMLWFNNFISLEKLNIKLF